MNKNKKKLFREQLAYLLLKSQRSLVLLRMLKIFSLYFGVRRLQVSSNWVSGTLARIEKISDASTK